MKFCKSIEAQQTVAGTDTMLGRAFSYWRARLCRTASFTSSESAPPSNGSSRRKSMARRVPLGSSLKSPCGSSRAAPRMKVSLTLSL